MSPDKVALPKSSVHEPSLYGPSKGAPTERAAPFPEAVVHSFIHSSLAESRVKELIHETGKTYGHHPHSPVWSEGRHTIGCGLLPLTDR